jgi:hypothetical protein
MATTLDRHRTDLNALKGQGEKMLADLHARHLAATQELDRAKQEAARAAGVVFESSYQGWYTEARSVIGQLIPDRLQEFDQLYRADNKRKALDSTSFAIQDWLNGVRSGTRPGTRDKIFDDEAAITMRFQTQFQILQAAERRFDSTLFDIRQLVQADLLDSEILAARELLAHGFLRASGIVAGVVLEKHLKQACMNHKQTTRKARPTISDLNDALKNAAVIDVPLWRQIQRLGDIRNLCGHDGDREPSKDEVDELVSGVEKISKTLF